MTEPRLTASTINDAQLDALYERLARVRDAVALHWQGLLTTAELYAVIESGAAVTEATAPVVSVHGARDLTPDAAEALDALVAVAKQQITEPGPGCSRTTPNNPAEQSAGPAALEDPPGPNDFTREHCPHCNATPWRSRVDEHVATAHADIPPCTATVNYAGEGLLRCVFRAWHTKGEYGDWHASRADRPGGRYVWNDNAFGATPHGASSEEQH